MGTVRAICRSEKRGTVKKNIDKGTFTADWGLKGDAHGGNWHRQVSLLSGEQVSAFNEKGAKAGPGAFGENLLVDGFDFSTLPVGSRLKCGDALFEITQIGKECHTHCQIYHRMGDCIMPREGTFARVLTSGEVKVGDEMVLVSEQAPVHYQAAVITLSDKGAKGLREDKSGPAICKRLADNGYDVLEQILLPDDQEKLEQELIRLCDQRRPDLILTTGGTGFSARDLTPEATLAVAERQVPGISEAIRSASMEITSRAMLSRGISVIRGKTLIINLPGSTKACMESMDVFLDTIPHAMDILRGQVTDCARV